MTLQATINANLEEHNANPKPFVSIKTAETILVTSTASLYHLFEPSRLAVHELPSVRMTANARRR